MLAEARVFESDEKATPIACSVWPESVRSWSLAESQSRTFPSMNPAASHLPSGEKATLRGISVLSMSLLFSLRVTRSHRRTVMSKLAVIMSLPSGEKAEEQMPLRWASS